jgi:hypothetical protein
LQEGEIKLVDASKESLSAHSSASLPLLPSSAMSSLLGGASRRKTADQVLIGSSEHSTTAAGSRVLIRQLTSPIALLNQPSTSSRISGSNGVDSGGMQSRLGGLRAGHLSSSSGSQAGILDGLLPPAGAAQDVAVDSSAGGGGLLPSQVARLSGVVLAVMGPGSCVGENILGYDASQV